MEKKFKAFERVIARFRDKTWMCDLYSHYNAKINRHVTLGFCDLEEDCILPYEGNEHLVGSTDEPDEEVRLDYWEWIMVSSLGEPSDKPSEWYLEQINHISGKENIETKRGSLYSHFIRFSDFNPNDMEETRKHILEVRNGKIVRYKD